MGGLKDVFENRQSEYVQKMYDKNSKKNNQSTLVNVVQ